MDSSSPCRVLVNWARDLQPDPATLRAVGAGVTHKRNAQGTGLTTDATAQAMQMMASQSTVEPPVEPQLHLLDARVDGDRGYDRSLSWEGKRSSYRTRHEPIRRRDRHRRLDHLHRHAPRSPTRLRQLNDRQRRQRRGAPIPQRGQQVGAVRMIVSRLATRCKRRVELPDNCVRGCQWSPFAIGASRTGSSAAQRPAQDRTRRRLPINHISGATCDPIVRLTLFGGRVGYAARSSP